MKNAKMWVWNKTISSRQIWKKDDWRRTCNVVSVFHRPGLFLRFCSIKTCSFHMWLNSKRCLGVSWSHCDRKIEYGFFFDYCGKNRKIKNKIPQKINSMRNLKNNEILNYPSMRRNHSWRFTAGWKWKKKLISQEVRQK